MLNGATDFDYIYPQQSPTFTPLQFIMGTYILIKSLSNPHDDPPQDMQLSAQLIVDGHIFLQMMPVVTEPSDCWKLVVNCRVPHHAHTFLLAIMRHSRTRGNRLLGSIVIGRDVVLLSIKRTAVGFCSKLAKVNPDGPCLELWAQFSVSESTITSSGTSDIHTPANQSKISLH
ncbi:hypothetical protein FB451DRAFT_1213937 [Mycena latifolia]|nr:hypothetical protein FB451DRAFT_1213937 [Mycena latifolia]